MSDLETKTRNLVNAAKAWHRADDSNIEQREKRLHNAIRRYLDLEATLKERARDRNAHRDAAEKGIWLDREGQKTPYSGLEGKHLYHIRKRLAVDSPHYEGICEEIARRAAPAGKNLIWAEGIPFAFEKNVVNGDETKLSFRNLLMKKLEHVEIDREGFVLAWSGYMHHGLSSKQAHALYEGWKNLNAA